MPVGHSKVTIQGPSSAAAMGWLPGFVECLVVATPWWIKATAPSPTDKIASEWPEPQWPLEPMKLEPGAPAFLKMT